MDRKNAVDPQLTLLPKATKVSCTSDDLDGWALYDL